MLETKISELRKENNISQEQLAEILNTSRQAVSKWERGEAYPDIDKLKNIATFFNVSIDYLLGYDLAANSINNFIDKIDLCLNNNTTDISLDEIKIVVYKNSNNFSLLIKVITYLIKYSTNRQDALQLIIEYCQKALAIFQQDNPLNINREDIQNVIVFVYVLQERYDLAKQYIEDHRINNSDVFLAECEFELGNNDKATELISASFLNSFSDIVNGNLIQARISLKENKVEEAYDLVKWSISFIKSISKKDDLFLKMTYILTFLKAVCEKYLNLDYEESLNFLKDKRNDLNISEDKSDYIKFYHNENASIHTFLYDIETRLKNEYDKFYKNTIIADASFVIYNEIFGGESDE